VLLVIDVVGDVKNYFIFLIIWIFMFSFFYRALGIKTESEIGIDSQEWEQIFKSSWEMSTRGDAFFDHTYWSSLESANPGWVFLIVHFCVLIETINQVYLKIIMFGFLIAMIKSTYDNNNKNKLKNGYVQRCGMNQFSYSLYRLIPLIGKKETDLVVVSAYFSDTNLNEVKK
jgi:hypothetical protein